MADRPDGNRPDAGRPGGDGAEQGPVIRDKRRIDPVTGEVRAPGEAPAASPGGAAGASAGDQPATGDPRLPGSGATEADARVAELEASLAERTADLQRLQAEYVNYRRRVERDREVVRETAVAGVLADLLPVLDDVHLARQHGDLEGPFKAVAESLESVLGKLGLQRYGEPGEPFDPNVHEALMHTHAPDVTEPTAVQVLQPGYRMATGNGDRVLRPARVAVADPEA